MKELDAAMQIAKEAGEMIKGRLGDSFETEQKSSVFDVVTEVDKASEQLIRSRIAQYFPTHKFLGEEESFVQTAPLEQRIEQASAEPYVWIVDPIDGTSNYVQRIPGFTVSIGLACKGEMTVGVIYDPCRDELFWAEKGKGAFMNGVPICVAATQQLSHSVVGTGFPSDREMRAAVMRGLERVGAECRTLRALGSAALHMAYVASGKLTAFWEYGLHVWDVAAGALIVQEAGGSVTDVEGRPYSLATEHLMCSNGRIHAALQECVNVG
jgi:myo-inositol-1(or 4)-monophosphatase